jgi:hypothetical protein
VTRHFFPTFATQEISMTQRHALKTLIAGAACALFAVGAMAQSSGGSGSMGGSSTGTGAGNTGTGTGTGTGMGNDAGSGSATDSGHMKSKSGHRAADKASAPKTPDGVRGGTGTQGNKGSEGSTQGLGR